MELENGMLIYREREPEEACKCGWCGGSIYAGEDYYDLEGESVCEECMRGAMRRAEEV